MSDIILGGHLIAELKLIFRIVPRASIHSSSNAPDHFLTYVQRFDIVPQSTPTSATRVPRPEQSSSLYILKRAKRADGSTIGDVVPLCQLRGLVNLVPRFHEAAHRGLTDRNSSSYCTEFFLNKYFYKEIFWALHNSNEMHFTFVSIDSRSRMCLDRLTESLPRTCSPSTINCLMSILLSVCVSILSLGKRTKNVFKEV
jgi:hypothetical protein